MLPRLRPGNSSDGRWFNVAWAENECERTDSHLLDPIPLPVLFFGGGHRVRVVENTEGLVYEDEKVKVSAFRVDHEDWDRQVL